MRERTAWIGLQKKIKNGHICEQTFSLFVIIITSRRLLEDQRTIYVIILRLQEVEILKLILVIHQYIKIYGIDDK